MVIIKMNALWNINKMQNNARHKFKIQKHIIESYIFLKFIVFLLHNLYDPIEFVFWRKQLIKSIPF